MGRIKLTRKRTYRKSSLVKDAKGRYHCPLCGTFRSNGKKKKK